MAEKHDIEEKEKHGERYSERDEKCLKIKGDHDANRS